MSSDVAPNSIACAACAIMVPASVLIIHTPTTRSVSASAMTFTKPSVSRFAFAAVGHHREFADFDLGLVAARFLDRLFLRQTNACDFGCGVDDAGDDIVVHDAGEASDVFSDRDAFILGLVR